MNVWLDGLSVSILGMLVVFSGLVVLIVVISLIKAFSVKEAKPQPAKVPEATPAPAKPAPAPQGASPQMDPSLVAAITGAIAHVLTEGGSQQMPQGFVVRRIRRA